MNYPKRLIEVDLPIKRISAHARREKSVGPLSTLHIWWARRPLAACRAVICAALWPDPADPNCPPSFREKAASEMQRWASHDRQSLLEEDSRPCFEAARKKPGIFKNPEALRTSLLHFIADFAKLDNSTTPEFLATSRALTQAAHEALGSPEGTKSLVLDPFAGGGSIPLEALRIGADAFASDLNPVPVLLNKVMLEYIPKYGHRLAAEVRKWGTRIRHEAEKELSPLYPPDPSGANPIAYLWAKTIRCEGPSCGVEIPIMRGCWLSKAPGSPAHVNVTANTARGSRHLLVEVHDGKKPSSTTLEGTVRRGSVTCPKCGYTVARSRVESAAKQGELGETMLAVVTSRPGRTGRQYRSPSEKDTECLKAARQKLARLPNNVFGSFSTVPDEPLPYLRSIFNVHVYGVSQWAQLFNDRQLFAAVSFSRCVHAAYTRIAEEIQDKEFAKAITTVLALAADRQINAINRTCYWNPTGQKMQAGFARQAIPMFWDYCEANPFGGSVGSWDSMIECVLGVFDMIDTPPSSGNAEQSSATEHPLPDDSVDAVITDPPYYDAVPYADLSDFFYVWLKRMLGRVHPSLFKGELSPKKLEVVQLAERNPAYSYKTKENFEQLMTVSLAEARRVAKPLSVSVVVFAHQSTAGWEAMLSALIRAGWIVTASWPIDTEMPTRVRAQDSAVLASSIHLACRPRENPDGSVRTDEIGDWRDVLAELPRRIHEWMPRLAAEGVVGADAIFACLGPALEIFSRYSRVEKANGDAVTLKEYLEQVWAAVAKEALTMIFTGADTSAFEEDARLTAMWLWTLKTGENGANGDTDQFASTEDEESANKGTTAGFALEYDAARKIAQGLGAHLESLETLVEINGERARLLPVSERARPLFGKDGGKAPQLRKKRGPQMELFKSNRDAGERDADFGEAKLEHIGTTTLDRVHQSMILFAAGRSEALKRFLVDDGAGNNTRFWTLAQALSALYPTGTDEKRWVDGVLARKKGLGF